MQACSAPPSCTADQKYSLLTVNPQDSPCDYNCECSNQWYTGRCVDKVCQSKKREECTSKGSVETCVLTNSPDGCTRGTRICQEDGLNELLWGDCRSSRTPENTKSACRDGLDNDCDGKTDTLDIDCKDVIQCAPGRSDDCYTGPTGTMGKGPCLGGKKTCTEDGDWGACLGEITPQQETCNGLDDDCNGVIDDAKQCDCTPGDVQECYSAAIETVGKGSCKKGKQSCNASGKWGECLGQILPEKEETCNKKDDNCDGQIDEGCECLPGEEQACYTGTPESTKDTLPCKSGTRTCSVTGKWGRCFLEVTPEPEVCDGKDNDCNGKIDDSKECECWPPGGVTQECYFGAPATKNKGLCAVGIQRCEKGGKWSKTCEGQILPAKEICNGKDDNCDGAIDDGGVCKCWPPGITRNCTDGIPAASVGKGICKAGTQLCGSQGTWGLCQGVIAPQPEDCNLKDDDCDGVVDNTKGGGTNSLLRACHQSKGCSLDASGKYVCKGACQAGTQACINGNWGECSGQVTPVVEVCNGKDDDCNGMIDDKPTDAPLCRKQSGSCLGARVPVEVTRGGQTISGCVNGQWRSCDVQDYKDYFAQYDVQEGTVCNDVDNDCDGQIDRDVPMCQATVAGSENLSGFRDAAGTKALFHKPSVLAFNKGRVFVADLGNYLIRQIDPCGNVISIAGAGQRGDRDGKGPSAELGWITAMAFADDAPQRLFISDNTANKIKVLDMDTYEVTTIAGSGARGRLDGQGHLAEFVNVRGLDVSADGKTLYVSDANRIRKLTYLKAGVCGGSTQYTGYCVETISFVYKPADANKPSSFDGIAFSGSYLYIVDAGQGSLLRLTLSTKTVTVLKAGLEGPTHIVFSQKKGNLYIGGRGATQSTFAKLYKWNVPSSSLSVLPVTGRLGNVSGLTVAVDSKGEELGLFYSQDGRQSIKEYTFVARSNPPQRCVIPYIGGEPGQVDGPRTKARLNAPKGMTYHKINEQIGRVYVADSRNHIIRQIDSKGDVSVIAGQKTPGFVDGPASGATFYQPADVAYHPTQNAIYVVDQGNHSIRKIDLKTELVTTFAGNGKAGMVDAIGKSAQFNSPSSIAIDKAGDIFVADTGNGRVRKIDSSGKVTTYINSAQASGVGGIAFGPQGALFFVNGKSYDLRKAVPYTSSCKGTKHLGLCITMVVGSNTNIVKDDLAVSDPKDAQGFLTTLGSSVGHIDIDRDGTLYIGMPFKSFIWQIRYIQNGSCGTKSPYTGACAARLGAKKNGGGDKDGETLFALFNNPYAVLVLPSGDLWVADTGNHRIRVIPWRP